jgi:hypothetical protein
VSEASLKVLVKADVKPKDGDRWALEGVSDAWALTVRPPHRLLLLLSSTLAWLVQVVSGPLGDGSTDGGTRRVGQASRRSNRQIRRSLGRQTTRRAVCRQAERVKIV